MPLEHGVSIRVMVRDLGLPILGISHAIVI